MSETGPQSDARETTPAPPPRRRRWGRRLAAITIVALVVLVAVTSLVVRFGVLTSPGRAVVESTLDSLNLAGYGRLHVEGLDGDVWRDFTIRRLTINDDNGPWLDARAVRMRWDWTQLLRRRFAVNELDSRLVTVLRAPRPKRTPPGGGASVSVNIDKLVAQLELLPSVSTRYGLYDLTGGFELRRLGGMAGHVSAASLTHAGDRVDAVFDLGRDKTIRLALDAHEAQGGAIAGALGLAALTRPAMPPSRRSSKPPARS